MKVLRVLLVVGGLWAAIASAQAQMLGGGIVFDPSNYAQNLLTASRSLEEVDNQITALGNQAAMLTALGRNLASLNLSQLPAVVSALTQISVLVNQAGGIAFNLNATDQGWLSAFPGTYPPSTPTATLGHDAQLGWQQAMASFEQSLQVQAQVVENAQADVANLSSLVDASQGAVGGLQAVQAGNQLLALSIKQQLQMETLMAVQYRATALDGARAGESQAAAQSAFASFIGSSQAYTAQ